MKFRRWALMVGLVLVSFSTARLIDISFASSHAQTVPSKVVNDQVAEYQLAVKAGSQTDRCVQAGFVASAYVQVSDQPNYQKWVGIRHQECQAAGLPQ